MESPVTRLSESIFERRRTYVVSGRGFGGMAKVALWLRREKRFWIVCLLFAMLFIIGSMFELANANDAEISVEQAVRNVLSRRRTIDISVESSAVLDGRPERYNSRLTDDDEGADENDEDEQWLLGTNSQAAMVCVFGTLFSLYTLVVEHMKWDPKSFQRFSIATKIPVEVFCVSGPLVLVSAIIYSIMAGLLFLGGGSSSAFFIAASWSAIMIDMSFVCYSNPIYEVFTNRIDLILHIVNLVTVFNAFNQLRFFPYTFVICGLVFWAVVIGIRIVRRIRGSNSATPNGFRPGSP